MNLQVIYCNHQTASLGLRERLAFTGEEQLAAAYSQLRAQFPGSEAVVLSTCNRVEVYTAQNTEISAPTHDQLAEFLSDFHGVPLEEFQTRCFWVQSGCQNGFVPRRDWPKAESRSPAWPWENLPRGFSIVSMTRRCW